MSEKFQQYNLTETLSKKYSHMTYLASPVNEPEHQVVLTVFASSLFHLTHERESWFLNVQRIKQLRHRHLVPILDLGIEDGQPFVVREYLPNGSLRSRLKKISPRRLELRDVLTIVSEVGLALTYAHENNVIHGNIKPENIFFNANDCAILADFALVGRKDAIIRDQTAEEYAFCYMAPEQFSGTCDARSDQYALGCLAYELITGRVPFASQSLASMMGHHSNARPVPLSECGADLPASLEVAILKTLAKDPAERFFDFSLLLEIIRSILSPPPAFPLARSAHSRKNRTISHPVQAAEAEGLLSPIRKRAAKRAALQPSGQSEVEVEVERAEPTGTLPMSDASLPEWTGIIPLPESQASLLHSHQITSSLAEEAYLVDDRANEQEISNVLLTDHFVGEENILPVTAYLNSVHGYNEYVAAEMTLALARRTDVHGPRTAQLLYGRRVLALGLLLSVIVALIMYVFGPLMVTTSDTSLHTANKMAHLVTTQTTGMSMTQASDPVTVVPTVQPSVTTTPTAQPIVLVPSIPAFQPPTPTPAPMPTPTLPTSYEAEASQNTIANGAQILSCSKCSGGYSVGYLGNGANGADGTNGTLQFNNVYKNIGGQYKLRIYYIIAGSDTQIMHISVNDGPEVALNVPRTSNGDTIRIDSITISLNAGNNSIHFSNPQDYAPDIDRIVV